MAKQMKRLILIGALVLCAKAADAQIAKDVTPQPDDRKFLCSMGGRIYNPRTGVCEPPPPAPRYDSRGNEIPPGCRHVRWRGDPNGPMVLVCDR